MTMTTENENSTKATSIPDEVTETMASEEKQNLSPIIKPNRPRIHITDYEDYDIYGVDATFFNQYCGPQSDFSCVRMQYDFCIEDLIQLVGRHMKQQLYTVVSMTATEHTLIVVCRCRKMMADMPNDMFWPVDAETEAEGQG